jgi:hypothetical protein
VIRAALIALGLTLAAGSAFAQLPMAQFVWHAISSSACTTNLGTNGSTSCQSVTTIGGQGEW